MRKNRHWLLTMAMLLSSIMVSAHDFEMDGIYYNILSYTDLTVEVTFRGDEPDYYTDTYTGDIILKSDVTYNGKNYKVVGIGFHAFLANLGLKSITIPESITSIGEASFAMCSSLTSVTIPSGVTSIGLSAFANCSGLKSIVVDANNPIYDSRENCNAVIETATNTLVAGATCTIIPTSVTSIGEQAFNSCEALTSIEIPCSIASIGDLAFQSCGFTNIICKAVTPPAIAASSFSEVNKSIPVYVPASSVSAYQTANYWSEFNNIQPIPSNDLASGVCGDNLTWKLTDEHELIIEGIGDMYSQGSDSWSEYNEMIKTVTFSEGVTSIGKWGFYGCSSLTSISLPESVTSVGSYAFSDCSSLTTITIPENSKLTSIGSSAFSNCTSLTAINIPEGVTRIESNAFSSCSNLTSITLPESVTSIGHAAFSDCNSLAAITLPEGVTSIESQAFDGCSSLTSITLPESVTIIMSEAFNKCSSLTAITIPENSKLTSIEMGAFTGCSNLTAITIPESVKAIEAFTFSNCSSLTAINIPESVTSIGYAAFAGCSNLTSITIPESVTNIGEIAFVECGKLASVISLSSIAPTIASDAFASISSSAVLTIPSGSISSYEDAGWTSYFSSVVEIKEDILATSLALDVTEASLAPNETLTLTATLLPEDVTNPALSWTSSNESVATVDANGVVTAAAVGEAIITVCTTDGSELSASCDVSVKISGICGENLTWVLDEATRTLTIFGEGDMYDYNHLTEDQSPWKNYTIKEVIVEEGVTSIGGGAFAALYYSECDVASVSLPEGLESIGGAAFSGCSLSEINFPSTLKSIGGEAFGYCSSLEEIYIPASVVSVAGNSFYGVVLTSIVVDEENIVYDSREECNGIIETATNKLVLGCTNTTIPEGVKVIAEFAFTSAWDSEKVLSIPSSVTSIEALAFYHGMTSALKEVVCYATTPPVLAESAFCLSADNIPTLRVPASSVEAYKAADGWKEFYIEPIGGVLVTSLTLDITEASLAPNETLSLTATLLPEDVTNPALSWASSNDAVATVNTNGVVTAVADGEAIITVSTTDGSELSASCKVVVTTEEVVEYDNMIYFEDVTVFTNSTVSHPLQLKNTVDMTAVQFDLYLPEGVTLATDARGRYAITFNADRADNTTHTLSSALQSDGAIRVLCYSTESYEFLGSEGAIFYFPLEIAEMEDGDYDMVIKNIVLTDVAGKKYEIPSMTSTITVLNVAPGDCNGDNTIDVADIVVLANSILGNTADGFVEKAADYNADGAVDVADIVNIANYILNGNNTAARALVREIMFTRAAAAGYSFDILPFVLDAVGSKTIAIELTDPTESFTAFQCDLYLPEGISVDKDKRGRYAFSFNEERTDASCHTLSSALQDDGAIRVLCYSADIYNFLGTEGALLNIPLTAETSLANGVYEFSIANTVLTYVDGVKVMPETYKGSIVVGDGGEVKNVKLYGRYTSEVLDEYTAAFGTNAGITCLDLTEALYLPADGSLTTGNSNTIVYLAEGDALANENNVVVGDECANLMLADGYAFSAPVAFNASQASYERELAEGKYGTIVLPFAPNTDDYVFYALTSVGDDALIFDEVQSPVANTPYLYKLRDGKSATQITNNEVAVSSELTPTETATWQMVGSFTNQTIVASEDADTYYYVYTSSDNQLHKVTNTLTVKPYRAYFTTNSTNGTRLAIRTRGGEETLIDAAEVEGLSPEVYYDLSGRRVDNPVKGVYIVNGKKVVF